MARQSIFFASAALVLCAAVFWFFDYSYHSPGDQFYYMNMARAVLDGDLPYRDFFYAGQPLMIYSLGVFYAFLGANSVSNSVFVLFSSLLVLACLILAGRRLNPLAGASAALLFCGTEVFAVTSMEVLGTSVSLLFVFSSLLCFFSSGFLASGLFASAAVLTRLNALPSFLVLASAAFLRKKKTFFSGASLGFLSSVFASFLFPSYLGDSVWYHLAKKPLVFLKFGLFDAFFERHAVLFLAGVFAFFYVGLLVFRFRSFGARDRVFLIGGCAAANALFLAFSRVFLYHYFVFLVPFLALLIGFSFSIVYGEFDWARPVFFALFLALFFSSLPALHSVLSAPSLSDYGSYSEMMDVLVSQAKPGDELMSLSFYNPPGRLVSFLSFETGLRVPSEYLDASLFRKRFDFDADDFRETVEDEKTGFLLWELAEWENFDIENYEEVLGFVWNNSVPVYSKREENTVLFLSVKDPVFPSVPAEQEPVFPEPVESVFYYRFLSGLGNSGPVYESGYGKASFNASGDLEKAFFAENLKSNGSFGGSFLPQQHPLLLFPLFLGKKWQTSSGLVSTTWVVGFENDTWELLTVSYDPSEKLFVGAVFVSYDSAEETVSRLSAYQRFRPSRGSVVFLQRAYLEKRG